MSKPGKIGVTKDYSLFARSDNNRDTNVKKHKKLLDSMQKYGFLKCFPVVCRRDKDGKLTVKDGQHRLMIASSLELPVYWVEEEVDFDIALVNCTAKTWALRDYAKMFAEKGVRAYQEGLDFSQEHGIPLGTAFALLAGTCSFGNVQDDFVVGKFKVKDRPWADAVAGVYAPLVLLAPEIKVVNLLLACMAVCRVPDFDAKRLIDGARTCRGELKNVGTRDDFLTILEKVYNHRRTAKHLVGLKLEAARVMRERSAKTAGKPASVGKVA